MGDTVWVVNAARTDSLACVTDGDGRYQNDPLTNVPDLLQAALLKAVPNPDPRALILEMPPHKDDRRAEIRLYDLRGHNVTTRERLPAGSYVARAVLPDGQALSTKLLFTQSIQTSTLKLEQRMATRSAKRETRGPIYPLSVDIKIHKQGYVPISQGATLQPEGTAIEPIALAVLFVLSHGRTGDEIGNLLANNGTWKFTNTVGGESYLAPIDSEGYWSVSIPDTIPANRVFDVEFVGNTDVRPRTHTFLKQETPTNGPMDDSPKLFSAYDVHGYNVKLDELTMQELTRENGLLALTFRQSSADDNTTLELIIGYLNIGVSEWGLGHRHLYNRLDKWPSGEYIGDSRKEMQDTVLDFVQTIDRLPGEIAQPYFSNTERSEGMGTPPDIYNGKVMVREKNDTGPGNIRGPPGESYMTVAIGWTPYSSVIGTLALEILEALGANDDSSGSNSLAAMFDEHGQIQLSPRGEVVISVANTYKTSAFRMTQW
jgi:hypothetical protein